MSDPIVWKLRDPSQPYEHLGHPRIRVDKLMGYPGEPEHWVCSDSLCPGGREIVLHRPEEAVKVKGWSDGKVWVGVEHE